MTDLDQMIAHARSATVDRAVAERYVHELDRWARPAPPAPSTRRWVPWLAAGLATAALVLALWPADDTPLRVPVRIGEHVAVVAAPATTYRVVRADAEGTEIAIDHGAVTARLWPTARAHHLVLSGGGVAAIATGTIYRLAVGATGPIVSVIEGTVEVRASDGVHVVPAGASWPTASGTLDRAAEQALLALAATSPLDAAAATSTAPAPIGDAADPVAPTDAAGGPRPADVAAPPHAVGAPDTAAGSAHPRPERAIKDRWRTARLLRGQGQFVAALAACLAIADARDPTWSPIALVEAVRIELGPLANPERAIVLADRMIREWPADALAAETRELRCRALRQLGRGNDCAPLP